MSPLVNSLLTLGKSVAAALAPDIVNKAIDAAPELLKIGQDAVEAIRHAKATIGASDAAELEAVAGDIEARIERISRDVDATADKLRG